MTAEKSSARSQQFLRTMQQRITPIDRYRSPETNLLGDRIEQMNALPDKWCRSGLFADPISITRNIAELWRARLMQFKVDAVNDHWDQLPRSPNTTRLRAWLTAARRVPERYGQRLGHRAPTMVIYRIGAILAILGPLTNDGLGQSQPMPNMKVGHGSATQYETLLWAKIAGPGQVYFSTHKAMKGGTEGSAGAFRLVAFRFKLRRFERETHRRRKGTYDAKAGGASASGICATSNSRRFSIRPRHRNHRRAKRLTRDFHH